MHLVHKIFGKIHFVLKSAFNRPERVDVSMSSKEAVLNEKKETVVNENLVNISNVPKSNQIATINLANMYFFGKKIEREYSEWLKCSIIFTDDRFLRFIKSMFPGVDVVGINDKLSNSNVSLKGRIGLISFDIAQILTKLNTIEVDHVPDCIIYISFVTEIPKIFRTRAEFHNLGYAQLSDFSSDNITYESGHSDCLLYNGNKPGFDLLRAVNFATLAQRFPTIETSGLWSSNSRNPLLFNSGFMYNACDVESNAYRDINLQFRPIEIDIILRSIRPSTESIFYIKLDAAVVSYQINFNLSNGITSIAAINLNDSTIPLKLLNFKSYPNENNQSCFKSQLKISLTDNSCSIFHTKEESMEFNIPSSITRMYLGIIGKGINIEFIGDDQLCW